MFSPLAILQDTMDSQEYATLVYHFGQRYVMNSQPCQWNKLGQIPLVSTFTGSARILLGTIHSIVHLVAAIFDSKSHSQHLLEVKLGGKNIGRGLIECIPIIGNIVCLKKDSSQCKKESKLAEKFLYTTTKIDNKSLDNHIILIINGKEMGRKSFEQMEQIRKNENIKKVNFWDEVRMIRKNTEIQ